jgi:hypothetical protein
VEAAWRFRVRVVPNRGKRKDGMGDRSGAICGRARCLVAAATLTAALPAPARAQPIKDLRALSPERLAQAIIAPLDEPFAAGPVIRHDVPWRV